VVGTFSTIILNNKRLSTFEYQLCNNPVSLDLIYRCARRIKTQDFDSDKTSKSSRQHIYLEFVKIHLTK